MDSAITFKELLQYTEIESRRWQQWFLAHPVGADARKKFQEFLDKAEPRHWKERKTLHDGTIKASKRKMVAQALLHGIHHRAQLATFLRQRGFKGMWVHDLILADVMT